MIRATEPQDTPALLELTTATGLFRLLEIDALEEVLDDYHAGHQVAGHMAITCVENGQIAGFAYYAPASMTEGTWYLYWIAMAPPFQGRGLGARLLQQAEDDARHHAARQMLIETSSQPRYAPTHRFYLRHGYEVAAVLKDYYHDGDDMVVYRKRLDAMA